MKNLADHHWTKKCDGEGRIEWCRSVCQEYFLSGGMKRMLEKDEKSAKFAAGVTGSSASAQPFGATPSSVSQLGRMRLLDVGSCFNPFLKFDEFLTVGIDIVPAVETVYKCDFLNLQLQPPVQLAGGAVEAFLQQLHGPIDALPAQLFHVVVFSLLLSYFPSPYQRWICCKKAHELLELHGLLLIITPDSSHQGRHALMMRSWRVAVESLGFRRYKYVKYSHLHLVAFRKVSAATSSDLVSQNYPEMLYIPQDFGSFFFFCCAAKSNLLHSPPPNPLMMQFAQCERRKFTHSMSSHILTLLSVCVRVCADTDTHTHTHTHTHTQKQTHSHARTTQRWI